MLNPWAVLECSNEGNTKTKQQRITYLQGTGSLTVLQLQLHMLYITINYPDFPDTKPNCQIKACWYADVNMFFMCDLKCELAKYGYIWL